MSTPETEQKAEESLQNLLDLGGDDDDYGGASVLDLDTQLTAKDLQLLPTLGSGKFWLSHGYGHLLVSQRDVSVCFFFQMEPEWARRVRAC